MKKLCNITTLMLLAAATLLGSCIKETHVGARKGEKEVEMTFVNPSTRAAVDAEDALMDVTLLVFEGDASTSKFLYSRYTWRDGDSDKFRTTLLIGSGLTIRFAANVKTFIGKLIEDGKLVEGVTTWEDAQSMLVLAEPKAFDLAGKGLPMWGQVSGVNITDQPNNNLGKIDLLRAVASTDIRVGASDFVLENGYLVFAADKGSLFHDPAMLDGGQVTGPKSPTGMTTTVEWTKAAEDNEISNYFYMYENDTPLTSVSGTNRPTKIILEGKWKDGESTFYPLTFRDYNSVSKVYEKKQVTRNNKYIIVVSAVYGNGWDDIEDAKNADDVNMEYTVVDWNQNVDNDIHIDGDKFISSGKEAELWNKAGSTFFIPVTTNFGEDEILFKFKGGAGDGVNTSIANDRFTVELKEVDGKSGFLFTANRAYADGAADDHTATMTVTVSRIRFEIVMTQVNDHPDNWDYGGNTTVNW